MWHISLPYWEFIVRGVVVYAALLFLLRLGGKREVGQMGAGELVAILLISNAVQNSMNGNDGSITGGLILASVIIAFSTFIAYITYKSKKAARIILGSPTLLIHNGVILQQNLKKELLNLYELRSILRRQGIHDLSEIHAAILESDGMISITKKSDIIHNQNNQNHQDS
ncbi:MAG: DUF421 domain-containing protein [Armatimonadota bacterium]